MDRFRVPVVVCVLGAAAIFGCWGCAQNEISFDRHGWGGPKLEYLSGSGGQMTVKSGMLMNEEFRWAESEFSFEFLDQRDLVWGIRLLDSVFAAARREALRNTRLKVGDREFVLGKDLPADQMWKFDTVLDAEFRRDKTSQGYKVLDGVWYERIQESGKTGLRVTAPREVRIKPNAWNTFKAKISGGKFVFSINGVQVQGVIQVDRRTNGRMGIFVGSAGPLLIRNLRLGPVAEGK